MFTLTHIALCRDKIVNAPSNAVANFQGEGTGLDDDGLGLDTEMSSGEDGGKQVVVGVCAMAKKSQSKPMKEILTRLQEFEYLRIVVFNEEVILKVSFVPPAYCN